MSLLISCQCQKEDLLVDACHYPPKKRQPLTTRWATIPLFAAFFCSLCIHSLAVIGVLNLSFSAKSTKIQIMTVYSANLASMATRENPLEDFSSAIIPEKHQLVSIESMFSSVQVKPGRVITKIDHVPPPAPLQKTVVAAKSPVLSSIKKPITKAIGSKIHGIQASKVPLPNTTNNNSVTMAEPAEPIAYEKTVINSGGKPANFTTPHDQSKDIPDIRQFQEKHLKDIGAKVMAALQYPAMAKRMKWQGQTYIGFLLLPSGEVTNLVVEKSSGFPVLDKQAIAAIQVAAPFIGPAKQLSIILPVRFQLDR